MAKFRNRAEDARELGFGSQNYKGAVRFILPDGRLNVRRVGLPGLSNFDIYHWLTTVSGAKLSVFIILGYLVINSIFGLVYFLIGPGNFEGISHSSSFQEFLGLFFFSAQTITTLGYGHIYPVSNGASVAASFESLLGLLSFAIATGIIFARFSRPKAHLLYSEKMLISPYRGITGLMFRVTNKKQFELIEAEANLTMTINNPETNKRDFFNLQLEINRVNFLALSWTVVHPIDEASPIYGLTEKELRERDLEVLVLIKAVSDTFSQTVYSRCSYKTDQIVGSAKFKPLVPYRSDTGKLIVSITDIHRFDVVKQEEMVPGS